MWVEHKKSAIGNNFVQENAKGSFIASSMRCYYVSKTFRPGLNAVLHMSRT